MSKAHLAESDAHPTEIPSELDVLVVGAGFSGLYLLHRFRKLGLSAKAFESSFESMDCRVKAAYDDIEFLMPEDEKKAYRDDPTVYSARYWTSKDPRYLTPYNERKLEHYSRLTYADLLYGSPDLKLRGWDTQRGQIMVRYGPPKSDVVLMPRSDGIFSARETLVGAIVSTVNGTDTQDSPALGRSIEGAQSFGNIYSTAREAFEEMNAYNIWEYGPFRFVFEDPFRNGEYRMYSPPAELMR